MAFAIGCFLILPNASFAGLNGVANFLSIPVDPVSAATGGLSPARTATAFSSFANPAAALGQNGGLRLGHVGWLAGQQLDAAALRLPLDNGRQGLALQARWVDHGEIPRFDTGGNQLQSWAPKDLSVGAAYALRYGRVGLGLGARYLQEDLVVISGKGWALDAGMTMDLGPARFGVAGRNLASQVKFDGEGNWELDRGFAASVAWKLPLQGIELDLGVDKTSGLEMLGHGGIHWNALPGTLVLRAGSRQSFGDDTGPGFTPFSLGFGVGHRGFGLDYAFLPHEELGGAHLVALGWRGP